MNRFCLTGYNSQDLDQERAKGPSQVIPPRNKRFCETCQSYQLKHGYARKGWKCLDCEGNGK